MSGVRGKEGERLFLIFKRISLNPHASADEILGKPNKKLVEQNQNNEDTLQKVCQKHIVNNFNGFVKSVHTYGTKYVDSDPDLIVQIGNTVKTALMWMKDMDIPLKILALNESRIEFEASDYFKKALGAVIIIRMDDKIPSKVFKRKFEVEIERINKIVDGSEI
jgi:hypothetical protein